MVIYFKTKQQWGNVLDFIISVQEVHPNMLMKTFWKNIQTHKVWKYTFKMWQHGNPIAVKGITTK